MRLFKKVICITLSILLFATSVPTQFLNLDGIFHAYGDEGIADAISYEDFADTENLQLNGDFLIQGNAIHFESGGGTGKSVFTKNKINLGENLSFSTAFSFRSISPSAPVPETIGGFTFTLQPISNTEMASDFHDESVNPSLSIAFTTEYESIGGGTARFAPMINSGQVRCLVNAVCYINGEYNVPVQKWMIGYEGDEPSEDNKVWIGYDGQEKILHILLLTPFGGYQYFNTYIDLSETLLGEAEVYAGFMGELGDAGNTIKINDWFFNNDLSILDEAIMDAEEDLLTEEMKILEENPIDSDYFSFPVYGRFGSTISWESSNEGVVDEDGTVFLPNLEQGPQEVNLTATIKKGSAVRVTKAFKITVKVPDNELVNTDYEWLKDTVFLGENNSLDNIVSDLYLPTDGFYGSTINWYSSNENVVSMYGNVIRPSFYEGDKTVILTAHINMNEYEREKTFQITVKAIGMTDEEILEADDLWLDTARILSGNTYVYEIIGDLNLPAMGQYGSTISWESSDEVVVNTDGKVTRPSYTSGDKSITLTATLSKGSNEKYRELYIIVKALEHTETEKLNYDKDWLTNEVILKGNASLDYIVSNLNLPTNGPMGSTITWTSSDETFVNVVDNEGKVTRPAFYNGDKTVTLTAALKLGSLQETKEFTVAIIKLNETDEEKFAADSVWLTDEIILKENTSLDYVVSNLNLPTSAPSGSAITWTSSDETVVNVVDNEGKVTRPAFYNGDKTVTLTATLKLGSLNETKEFTVTVMELKETDEEKFALDSVWLTDEIILKENTSLDNVTGNLNLPTSAPRGSTITWESDEPDVIHTTGFVVRPTYIVGDKVVTLTATIEIGTYSIAKTFTVTVKKIEQTLMEKIQADVAWLTPELILKDNSDLNNITGDINLPQNGENGSLISWSVSDYHYISSSGTVTRPGYLIGNMDITITATFYMIETSYIETKTFELTVKAQEMASADAAYLDYLWLIQYNKLGNNLSGKAVTENLSLPTTGKYNSTITWESSNSSVISNDGTVTRPKTGSGHKFALMTYTLTNGEAIYTGSYNYTVLEELDTTPPIVETTSIDDISTKVPWDTEEIVLTFSEPIFRGINVANLQTYGIELKAEKLINVNVNIQGNNLIIKPFSELSSGENKIIIPAGTFKDKAGNLINYCEIKFTVEPRPIKTISIVSSTLEDLAKNVDTDGKIAVFFDTTGLIRGEKYNDIHILDKSHGWIYDNKDLYNDILTLSFNTLQQAQVYEACIPAGAVQDRYGNTNEEKIIRFRTKYYAESPTIISTNPFDGETNVNVNRAEIYVTASHPVHMYLHNLKLTDNKGNTYIINGYNTADKNTIRFVPRGLERFEPNTLYTLSGPYSTIDNPSELEFSIQFKTRDNAITLNSTSPYFGAKEVYIDTPVKVSFNSPVKKGLNYGNITITDSEGNDVIFNGSEEGNTAILTSIEELTPSTSYTVKIPAGAYMSEDGKTNDYYEFAFATITKVDLQMHHLTMPDEGLVDRTITFKASEVEKIAWSLGKGHQIISYDWRIDGKTVATTQNFSHIFSTPGYYEVEIVIKDNKGLSYEFSKFINILPLINVNMTLLEGRDYSINPQTAVANSDGSFHAVNYFLKLEQDGYFVDKEKINVELFKDGIPQRNYVVTITSSAGEGVYKYSFKPQYGEFGTYELVFTYAGNDGRVPQTIRVPVQITTDRLLYTSEFTFRLYDVTAYLGGYYEKADSLDVYINGKKMRANKKWSEKLECYVYVINEPILANQVYNIEIEGWKFNNNVKIGQDGTYSVIYGNVRRPGGIQSVKVNQNESTIKGDYFGQLFFEGISAKLVLDVQGDWGSSVKGGYYEIKTTNDRFNLKVNYDGNKVQKIVLDPGLQLKNKEQLLIRMVDKNGNATIWYYCPYINVVSQPSVLGKKLPVSIQDGEYAVNWPTAFNGVMGGAIGFLDGIPVVDGGNFGIGGGMPKFEGEVIGNYVYPSMDLSFGVSGGYKSREKQTMDTQYKKLKKISIVGYEFEMSAEGGLTLYYDSNANEWSMEQFYILIIGEGIKSWGKGYKFLGVGFTAEIGVGAEVAGYLKIDNKKSDNEYSGYIRLTPKAFLRVGADFTVAEVNGYLNGKLPAEIHFPTGYIGVDVSIDAEIYAKALLWGKVIYEEQLYSVHWDNGKPKITLMSLGGLEDELVNKENEEFKLLPREYSHRNSNWVAEDINLLKDARILKSHESRLWTNSSINLLMENIYPESEPQLVKNGDELWLVWDDDNPQRDDINRTHLRYAVWNDGLWSEPDWLDNDETADFDPDVTSIGDGVLMAWHNISKEISEEEGLPGMLANSEISVTESIYTANDSSVNIITLTNDDEIDHSPNLASNGEKALLVWTKSRDLGFSLDEEEDIEPTHGSQLYYSVWNGSWSDPEILGDNNAVVLNSSLSMGDDEGLLLYTLDMDKDLNTYEDRKVYARLYQGNTWSEAIALSNNSGTMSAPNAVYINGEWFITWLEDGNIQYKVGLYGQTRTDELVQNIPEDYKLVAKSDERPLVALVYIQLGEEKAQGISALFYDVSNEQWGSTELITPQEHVKAISPLFTEDGKLNVAYSQATLITEAVPMEIDGVEEAIETVAISNKVDMKLLSYTPIHDVALLGEDGMFLSREFPLPSTVTTVYVDIRNQGDFSENVTVYLYDGNPDLGGKKIGETAQLIPARSSREVEIEWLVSSEENGKYTLYAVVQPENNVQEIDTENNTIHLEFSTADIAITELTCVNMAGNDYLVNVTIANLGSKSLENVRVQLENAENEDIIETTLIEYMEPGNTTVLTYTVSSSELVTLLVRVMPSAEVQEEFTDNNVRSFSLVPKAFEIETINPAHGDKQVNPDIDLTLTFNLNIHEGAGYEGIKLIDSELNEVAIEKDIEGTTLTITPEARLYNGIEYTLLIPVDALGDGYEHSLNREIVTSFTTITTNPEVVSAYPGESMVHAPLDTEIRIKFNQNVQKGEQFSEISLYDYNNKEKAINATFDGELLILNYVGKLNKNTVYFVNVPKGAVQNHVGAEQDEDYILVFKTADSDDGGNDGGDTGNDSSHTSYDNEQYRAILTIGGIDRTIEIQTEDGNGVVRIGDIAKDIFKGNQNAFINLPSITGIDSYTLEMPAEILALLGESSLTVSSPWGNIIIPAGMLSNMNDISGKIAGITIAKKYMTKLSEHRPVLQLLLTLDGVETPWSNSSVCVNVLIPYIPTSLEEESLESIVIWHMDDQGNIVTISNGFYNKSRGGVIFNTNSFSYFAVVYNKVDFKDVPKGAWYNSAVNFVAARGISKGTGNDEFSPNNKLTRGQFITMIMRAYGIEPDTSPIDNFADAGSTWYTGYLAAAKQLEISKGVGSNLFAPDNEITRQEMFTLLYNLLGVMKQLPEKKESNSERKLSEFQDQDQIDSWAREAMTMLVEADIVKGSSGKLTPSNTTTRAEMAQVLYNLMIK